MGSPALFSGNFVKFLKDKLNLFDKAYILTGTQDPRATATDAPKGSIMMRQTASGNGQVFFKLDNGSSTNWKLFTADTSEATKILETLKNQLTDSAYNLLTTNIGGLDGSTKWSSITGATFDPSVDAIRFTANAQVATSVDMLDATEFLADGRDLTSIDLSLFWSLNGAVPTGFTYEVSRDGGTNWFPITMERVGSTNAFHGSLRFDTEDTTETVLQDLISIVTDNTQYGLTGLTTKMAQKFVVPADELWKIQSISVNTEKNGSPVGTITPTVVRDNAGSPSDLAADLLSFGAAVSASTMIDGDNDFDIADILLTPGTYWVVWAADATYTAASGANYFGFRASSVNGGSIGRFISGSWNVAVGATHSFRWTLSGRALDARVRVTSAGSPSYPCLLDGYGFFYGMLSSGVQLANSKQVQRFVFDSVADNLNEFAITNFNPDPDLLVCWYVEAGQGFKYPAFSFEGATVVFPANTFNNGGVATTVTLIFEQNNVGIIDSSDFNTRLLAFNHLGSTDATDDRSTAGRGLFLRRLDGTLRELVINNDDEIEIWSV